jgi:hypothetical protein
MALKELNQLKRTHVMLLDIKKAAKNRFLFGDRAGVLVDVLIGEVNERRLIWEGVHRAELAALRDARRQKAARIAPTTEVPQMGQ